MFLVAWPAPEEVLDAIGQGLEEEGIPVVLIRAEAEAAADLARQGALSSRLDVGLGLNWTEGLAALHHRDLPADEPLFVLRRERVDLFELRVLGANAARLAKGDPLIVDVDAHRPRPGGNGLTADRNSAPIVKDRPEREATLEEALMAILHEMIEEAG